jgi:hypothetical protein
VAKVLAEQAYLRQVAQGVKVALNAPLPRGVLMYTTAPAADAELPVGADSVVVPPAASGPSAPAQPVAPEALPPSPLPASPDRPERVVAA